MNLGSRIGFATVLLTIAISTIRLESWAGADEPPLTIVDSKAKLGRSSLRIKVGEPEQGAKPRKLALGHLCTS